MRNAHTRDSLKYSHFPWSTTCYYFLMPNRMNWERKRLTKHFDAHLVHQQTSVRITHSNMRSFSFLLSLTLACVRLFFLFDSTFFYVCWYLCSWTEIPTALFHLCLSKRLLHMLRKERYFTESLCTTQSSRGRSWILVVVSAFYNVGACAFGKKREKMPNTNTHVNFLILILPLCQSSLRSTRYKFHCAWECMPTVVTISFIYFSFLTLLFFRPSFLSWSFPWNWNKYQIYVEVALFLLYVVW